MAYDATYPSQHQRQHYPRYCPNKINEPACFLACSVESPIVSSDLNTIYCTIKSSSKIKSVVNLQRLTCKFIDFSAREQEMTNIDWSECFDQSLDINVIWDKFQSLLNSAIIYKCTLLKLPKPVFVLK